MTASPRPITRRTQAERSETTRTALLEAAIDSLLKRGYAATTTRGVAKLANVSQGAQQHHFPSKSSLVTAAISHMVQKIAAQSAGQLDLVQNERARAEQLIDRLWEAHNLPLARAVFSIFHMAREDVEISRHIGKTLSDGVALVHQMIRALLPNLAKLPGFSEWLLLAETMMRGTVLMTMLPGASEGYAGWPIVRAQILADLDRTILAAKAPG
jgi:AcrR family transcriptional regulator